MRNFQPLTRRLALTGLAALASSRVRAQSVLRIAYLKSTSDLALAKAHGSLEQRLAPMGVSVVWAGPFAAAAPALEALNADAVDLTVGSSTAFVTARAAGVPLVLFGYQRMASGGEALLVKTGSPLKTLADLRGRSVAVNRGGTGEYILARGLLKAGIPLAEVKRVYLNPMDAKAAFARGDVDAWAIWDPFIAIAVESGEARVLADGDACASENAVTYFVRQDYLAANRPVVRAVYDVLSAENRWGAAHQDAAGALWAQELGLPPALAPRLGRNNTPPLTRVGTAQMAEVARIADWFAANGIVPQRPDLGGFLVDIGK
ncbi:MAG: aliphatic sulfonate ABC transporter substrate-binding protein [Acetobacteraceae bacterium]|nr:aliphatic sulfonate ABC transporter substrate-binding protein [Acetobacteraceae bacterium]